MGSHGDSVLESGGPLRCSRTARRLSSLVGRRRTSAAQVRSRKGALRTSWPKSTVARRADIQAEDRQVRVGSFSTELSCPRHVRVTPDSDQTADIPDRQLRAKAGSGRTHSITSSARASSVGGTVRPSEIAVFILITVRNYVGLFAKNLSHKINCVPRADFFQQIGPVEFDGTWTNAERVRDLLVGETPDDLSQHHALSRSQSRVAQE
jgi:hypothetical protein